MPESEDLYREVQLLREEQADQGVIVQALLRVGGTAVRDDLLATLRADRAMREVLLLTDGRRSQNGVPNANKAGVSRRVDKLANDLHLITLATRDRSGVIYRRTALDRVLGISRTLERDPDGD